MEEISDPIKARLKVLAFIATAIFAILFGRLWMLQGVLANEYRRLAEENRIRPVSVDAPRGLILDRHGDPLVKNRLAVVVTLEPERTDDRTLIKRLSKVLDLSIAQIDSRIASNKIDPIKPRVIQRDTPDAAIAYIKEHSGDFPGVELKVEAIREYPYGELAAHVVGYLGELSQEEHEDPDYALHELGDMVGKTGVEKVYDNLLAGSKGTEYIEVNALAEPLRVVDKVKPDPGNDIILTIDRRIQAAAEKTLIDGILRTKKNKYRNASSGATVVMTPKGEVVAMASFPTYDPAVFIGGVSEKQWTKLTADESDYPLNNRALMSAYPPASTFKIVTAAAGYQNDVMTSATTVVCTGRWTGMGEKWGKFCWKRSGHGPRNVVGALEESCDSFFYDIGYRLYKLPGERLQDWARRFGMGAVTGIDLPSEVEGRVPTAKWKKEWNKNNPDNQAWFPGDTVNMAIGQGDTLATPLQIASMYAAIAADGVIYKPYMVKSIVGLDGRKIRDIEPEKTGDLKLPSDQLAAIKDGLRRVVATGTAKGVFAGLNVTVSGKTGTAEVFGKDDYALFAAYAPSDAPEYVVVTVIEEGGGGSTAAAPAVRDLLAEIFSEGEAE